LISIPRCWSSTRKIIDDRQQSLGQVERIKKFTLLENEFSQETGEITATMKVKRKVVKRNTMI
jgi:long-chain acyl-CoA synthetase